MFVTVLSVIALMTASVADRRLAVTVYNQDFAVVKDTRPLQIGTGRTELTLDRIAAKIDPTSVQFSCRTDPTCRIIEQNFDYDLVGVSKLLQKMIDRHIEYVSKDGHHFAGTLLSYEGQRLTIADDTGIKIYPIGDEFQELRLAELPPELRLRPALIWQVDRTKSGTETVEVAYQTGGMTWNADYNVLLRPADKTLDLNAWVTLTNTSGTAYPECKLKLVAGDVHKVEEEFVLHEAELRLARSGVKAKKPPPGFEERQFGEYHLYDLGRDTTLKENQTKQMELFNTRDVSFSTEYKYLAQFRPRPPRRDDAGQEQDEPLDLLVTIQNKKDNHLGIPLPAGRVRIYQCDRTGQEHFVGEDHIDHTPKDEKVRLTVGKAFELLGSKTMTNRNRISDHEFTEDYRIRLRNHKSQTAPVVVVETLHSYLNWTIEQENVAYTKKDFRTIEFRLDVPANSEKQITYRVRYKRYTWWDNL